MSVAMRHPSSWTVFPQTELQEVLSVDEETGLLDGSEATSPDLSEDRAQDNTEQPTVQTAFQQALPAVPQVGFTEGPACVLARVSMDSMHVAWLTQQSCPVTLPAPHTESRHEELP